MPSASPLSDAVQEKTGGARSDCEKSGGARGAASAAGIEVKTQSASGANSTTGNAAKKTKTGSSVMVIRAIDCGVSEAALKPQQQALLKTLICELPTAAFLAQQGDTDTVAVVRADAARIGQVCGIPKIAQTAAHDNKLDIVPSTIPIAKNDAVSERIFIPIWGISPRSKYRQHPKREPYRRFGHTIIEAARIDKCCLSAAK